jgi:hypothetical protein
VQVNEKANNLNVISRVTTVQTSAKPSSSKISKVGFRVHIAPSDLLGIELIWQFFTVSCNKKNNELQKMIANFLV